MDPSIAMHRCPAVVVRWPSARRARGVPEHPDLVGDRPCVQGKRSQKGSWSITLEFCSTTASTRPGFLPRGEVPPRPLQHPLSTRPGRSSSPPVASGPAPVSWARAADRVREAIPPARTAAGSRRPWITPKPLNTSLERGRPCRTHSSGALLRTMNAGQRPAGSEEISRSLFWPVSMVRRSYGLHSLHIPWQAG
jgi:hypothetical protein